MSALLTTFGIDWHLLIAQVINFSILVAALTWFLYKPILKMVKERKDVVSKGINDAQESAKMLAQADSEVSKRVSAADVQAVSIVAAARESANAEKTALLKDAEARAAAVAKDAEARAQETAAKSLRESEREVARLAILAAEKVMRARV